MKREQYVPESFRKKFEENPVAIAYFDFIEMRPRSFNMREPFEQMCSGTKLNVLHSIYNHLLSPEEQSLFLADMLERSQDDEA